MPNIQRSLFVFFLPILVHAQEKIKTFQVEAEILYATVDRPGDLYLVLHNGMIRRYDKDGNPLASFSNTIPPTLFDPRDGARLFAYYQQSQSYLRLGPQLDVKDTIRVDPAFAIEPVLVCPGGDHHLWILDGADLSLKKINLQSMKIEAEKSLDPEDHNLKIKLMREYQNFVFLLEKKGIQIFNSIGIAIKTIKTEDLASFNFLGEELYYFQHDRIHFFDLFTGDKREVMLESAPDFVILTDERLFKVKGRLVEVMKYRP